MIIKIHVFFFSDKPVDYSLNLNNKWPRAHHHNMSQYVITLTNESIFKNSEEIRIEITLLGSVTDKYDQPSHNTEHTAKNPPNTHHI